MLHIKVEERTRELEEQKKTAFHSGKRALSSKPTIETAKRKNNQTKRTTDTNVKESTGIDG